MSAVDTEQSREQLWDRLSNESGRAYEAFRVYMFMNPAERNVVGAWRRWTENPEAVRPSPFFEQWSRDHAWSERARAHDAHIGCIRRQGMEEAIKEEAAAQARQAEQTRFRFNEMMTVAYDRAIECLSSSEWSESNLRSSDVMAIIKLHLEAVDKLGAELGQPNALAEGDWLEDKDDEEILRIMEEVDAEAEAEEPEDGSKEGEEDSEESEDGQK